MSNSSAQLLDEAGNPLPPIPQRYIRGMGGDMVEAERRWRETLKWRKEFRVDGLLQERHVTFDIIKKNYPHFVHKKCKEGYYCYYEIAGEISLSKIRSQGVTIDDVLRHYIYITEFIWKHLDLREDEGKLFTVMDLKGISMSDLRGDVVTFLRKAANLISEHYPERSFKIVVINSPTWFNMIWKIISPILSPATRAKVDVQGSKFQASLLKHINPEDLPVRFGGTDTTPIYGSEEELALKQYVDSWRYGPPAEVAPKTVAAPIQSASKADLLPSDEQAVPQPADELSDISMKADFKDDHYSSSDFKLSNTPSAPPAATSFDDGFAFNTPPVPNDPAANDFSGFNAPPVAKDFTAFDEGFSSTSQNVPVAPVTQNMFTSFDDGFGSASQAVSSVHSTPFPGFDDGFGASKQNQPMPATAGFDDAFNTSNQNQPVAINAGFGDAFSTNVPVATTSVFDDAFSTSKQDQPVAINAGFGDAFSTNVPMPTTSGFDDAFSTSKQDQPIAINAGFGDAFSTNVPVATTSGFEDPFSTSKQHHPVEINAGFDSAFSSDVPVATSSGFDDAFSTSKESISVQPQAGFNDRLSVFDTSFEDPFKSLPGQSKPAAPFAELSGLDSGFGTTSAAQQRIIEPVFKSDVFPRGNDGCVPSQAQTVQVQASGLAVPNVLPATSAHQAFVSENFSDFNPALVQVSSNEARDSINTKQAPPSSIDNSAGNELEMKPDALSPGNCDKGVDLTGGQVSSCKEEPVHMESGFDSVNSAAEPVPSHVDTFGSFSYDGSDELQSDHSAFPLSSKSNSGFEFEREVEATGSPLSVSLDTSISAAPNSAVGGSSVLTHAPPPPPPPTAVTFGFDSALAHDPPDPPISNKTRLNTPSTATGASIHDTTTIPNKQPNPTVFSDGLDASVVTGPPPTAVEDPFLAAGLTSLASPSANNLPPAQTDPFASQNTGVQFPSNAPTASSISDDLFDDIFGPSNDPFAVSSTVPAPPSTTKTAEPMDPFADLF